ncbi:MAG: tyrosine-type recombinase/integrase [Xanthobacteraceae bacterium]
MPFKLYKRGEVWWISGTVHGKSIRETTGSHDKKTAEAIRAKREAGLVSDHVFGAKATRTFLDATISYLDSGGSTRFLGKLTEAGWSGIVGHFGERPLKDITQSDLDGAARALYPGCTAETRNRQCYTPFIAVWNHAAKNGWAEVRVWSRPRKAKGTNVVRAAKDRSGTKPVAYDRAAAFVAAMSPAPAMVMTALFYTGMRPIELFSLEAPSVDVAGRWIVLSTSKTGEPRGVPMHEFLAPLFEALVARGAAGGPIFLTPRGTPYRLVEDQGGQLKSAIDGARRRSGIRDVSPYTGRHTVSTQLVINGVHPHIKDQILGHAADDMSRHYTNVPQRPLIDAINTLPVPEAWRGLDWWSDPVAHQHRLAAGTGRRTDLVVA